MAQQRPSDAIKQQLSAAQIQRDAVRKQAELASRYRPGSIPATGPNFDCDPLPPAEITSIVIEAAQKQQVQASLLRSVIEQESAGHPCAVSVKGAKGLMQLMPATIEQFHVRDSFDPKQNVDAGAQLLNQLVTRYRGDLPLVLAAYNAGPATVDQAKGVPDIKETRDYIESVLRKMNSDEPEDPLPPH